MKYRTQVQILNDVLDSIQHNPNIRWTKLIGRSNQSHNRLTPIVEKLIGSGCINEIIVDNKKTYVITQKGTVILEKYKQFHDMAGSFGLEL